MQEKNQKPTARKLRDARKRGEVVFSRDVSSVFEFVVMVVALWLLGALGFGVLQDLWLQATTPARFVRPGERLAELLVHMGQVLVLGTIVIMAIAAVGGIVGSFIQVGGLAAWTRLKPDVNHLNPAEGLKRIFSTRNLVNLLKVFVKTVLLSTLIYVVIRAHINPALMLGYSQPATIMEAGSRFMLVTLGWAAVIFALMAMLDYAHEHYEFMKQQRMSIEDVRNEHKNAEGDPINLGRRRSAYFEAVYFSLKDRVGVASAVIHSSQVAVAIQYLGDKDLPRIIARGEGDLAVQIRRAATEALIPMEMNTRLAQTLYEEVPLDQPIPRGLYRPVAKLLRWAHGE